MEVFLSLMLQSVEHADINADPAVGACVPISDAAKR